MDNIKTPEWWLANEHANVALASLVYDPAEDNLIVAALVAASTAQLMTAIKAQLEKNGNNHLKAHDLAGVEDSIPLIGAGRGYITHKVDMTRINARGQVMALAHKLCADPGATRDAHFYLTLSDPNAQLADEFIKRLIAATYITILPGWKDYLLQVGRDKELVAPLPSIGSFFRSPLRVRTNNAAWGDIVSEGLREGHITF